jgi:N-acetylglucosaminyldiphosphoundecaprenol N-acetyl-beta-D-mannosaminyltransferase
MSAPSRIDVLGSLISACDLDGALRVLQERVVSGEGGYVCFTNVHTVVEGRGDAGFKGITNGSFMSLADGKPVYWVARMRGGGTVGHAPGPDTMLALLEREPAAGHFFYGSTPETLARLRDSLLARIPGLRVSGMISPPFRPPTASETSEHLAQIRASGATFVWVGLGAPRQEAWMARHWRELAPAILFGVGAAFDFHAGTTRRAPAWMRRAGLEWLYRLWREPGRLWKRYAVTNSRFLYYLALDALRGRAAPLPAGSGSKGGR